MPDGLALPHYPRAFRSAIARCQTRPVHGRIEQITGSMIEARVSGVQVGELCRVRDPAGTDLEAEVVGIGGEGRAYLTPIGPVGGLSSRAEVIPTRRKLTIGVGPALLGRVLDGLGRVIDAPDGSVAVEARIPIDATPPAPLDRAPLHRALPLGTRAIDGLLTVQVGDQRHVLGPALAGSVFVTTPSKNK